MRCKQWPASEARETEGAPAALPGGGKAVIYPRRDVQQPRHMFLIAASVRAFSALSGSTIFPCCDAGVLDVADLPGAIGGAILS
jgi:hypothetical protein